MTNDATGRGYVSLRALRALERRMARLARRWRRFRREPEPAALAELRARFRAAADAMDELQDVLEDPGVDVIPVGPPSSPPPAREVIQASRELDACIWRASGEWQGFQSRHGSARLEAVESLLRLAVSRAETLRRALWTVVPPGHPTAGPGSPIGSPYGEPVAVEDLEQNLDALLWRITSDWQHLRRSPAPDRIGILRDEIQEALSRAAHLRDVLRGRGRSGPDVSPGPPDRPRGDSVPYHPYRDGFTGCYNREGFDAAAGAELKRCRRYRRSFGLLLVELAPPGLDDLRGLVERISSALREYDVLGRYVDRLFAVGLPESGRDETAIVARRVADALRSSPAPGIEIRVAAVTSPDDGQTLSALFGAARNRLASSEPLR